MYIKWVTAPVSSSTDTLKLGSSLTRQARAFSSFTFNKLGLCRQMEIIKSILVLQVVRDIDPTRDIVQKQNTGSL